MPSLKNLFKKKKEKDGDSSAVEMSPADVDELEDDDFNSYINSARDGFTDDEDEAPEDVSDTEETSEDTTDDEDTPPEDTADDEEAPLEDTTEEDEVPEDLPEDTPPDVPDVPTGGGDVLERLREVAAEYYSGDVEDPIEALIADMEEQLAERDGLSVEEYRTKRNDDKAAKQREDIDGVINGWEKDSTSLKDIDSEFEFMVAMKNPVFREAILQGKTVFGAYKAMKDSETAPPPEDTADDEEAPPEDTPPEREPIHQNIQSAGGGTGVGSKYPADMETDEFMKYINKHR